VNLYSAHMDPDDWQQPQQFRPERFLDESGNVVDRDRVIPFSLGIIAFIDWFSEVFVFAKFTVLFQCNLIKKMYC